MSTHQASITYSKNKRFKDLIVFVHFFGGTKLHMRRHVDLVNELGFDALTFNLSFDKNIWLKKIPLSRNKRFGLRHIWGDEIEDVFNSQSEQKIVFAFSNPAACAIDAIARRKARDIKGLITDSGPFAQMVRCSWNLLTHEYTVKNPFLRVPATGVLSAMWGLDHTHRLHEDISSLPEKFPILSIRGWEDPLVPPAAIDDAYKNVQHLHFETLALAKAQHLNGLKDFSDEYKPRVQRFLERFGTKCD